MEHDWEKQLSCASQCQHCQRPLGKRDQRVLSVYDHQPICIDCKQAEETRSDYPDQSKKMIASCITSTGKPYGNPASYCFHHFCPFKCQD